MTDELSGAVKHTVCGEAGLGDGAMKFFRDIIYPICPACDGRGGSEGYYGGDWTGCFCCNPDEDREEPVIRIWFWQVWRHQYNLWKMDRWVDRQIEKDALSQGKPK